MKKKPLSILAIMVILLTASCSRGVRMSRELAAIDSLMDIKPDSALALLGRMDSMPMRQSDRMYLELLRGKAMNKCDVLFTTDSVMLEVARYFDLHGNRNQQMLAYYVLGCSYRDLGDAPQAIEVYQRAVECADTTASDCDYSTLMRVHSQMNDLYARLRLSDNANREAEVAEKLCWKMGDTLNAMLFQQKSCIALYDDGKYDECIEKTKALYDRYMELEERTRAALVSVYIVKSYLAKRDYANTKTYLDIYESYCLSEPDHRKINGGLTPYYIYKGNYYLGIGNTDSAEYCFCQAMPEMHMLHNDVAVYKGLYRIFDARHQTDSVLKYAALYGRAKEESFASDIAQATIDAKHLYDYSVEQRKVQEERNEKARLKSKLYFSIALSLIALLLALVVFYVLYHKWYVKKKEQETELNQLTIDIQDIRLENQKKENAIQQHQLLLMESREKLQSAQQQMDELRQKMIGPDTEKDYQNQIEQLNSEIAILQSKQWSSAEILNELKSSLTNDQLENSRIVRKFLNAIETNQVASLSNDDWHKLRAEVEYRYPGFYNAMNKIRKLPQDEYRACLLTMAGCFRPSDLEILLEWRYNYASKKRKQLLKKIFGISGSASDFDRVVRESVPPLGSATT